MAGGTFHPILCTGALLFASFVEWREGGGFWEYGGGFLKEFAPFNPSIMGSIFRSVKVFGINSGLGSFAASSLLKIVYTFVTKATD